MSDLGPQNAKVIVCIQCGSPLTDRKCKLMCPRCGYFEDCSDGGTNSAHEMDLSSVRKRE